MELPIDYENAHWTVRKEAREQYVVDQKGLCMYCKSRLDESPSEEITKKTINWGLFPKNFLKYPVHLQHCHKTGMSEGAVHAYCNAVLWQYEGR
jgi:hypothetical protein